MNTLIAAAIRCSLMFLVPSVTYAVSAQWDLDPISGDWNTAANWTPMGVPNGPADTATFGLSNTTNVSISASTEVNGITFTTAATNPYTITASAGLKLTISGVGIVNNSGIAQNFVAAPSGVGVNAIRLLFKHSATAGSGTFFTMNGGATGAAVPGFTLFADFSSAGHGTFTNNGPTDVGTFGGGATGFNNSATASNGTFINNGGTVSSQSGGDQGLTFFNETSTAANGVFTNNPGTVSGAHGGITAFSNSATAANGTFTNNGSIISGQGNGFNSGSGVTRFFNTSTVGNGTFINNGATAIGSGGGFVELHDTSTAGFGTFTNNGAIVSGAGGGSTYFYDSSTAGNATLIANGGIGGGEGGTIQFYNESTGGTSRGEVFGNGNLDISAHAARGEMTIGSIEGDGNVFLGSKTLTVGSNGADPTFSGVIQDGGIRGGTGGSLTKIGSGTLILSGANTYTGNTNVDRGVLNVAGSINSNTTVHHPGMLAGTGTVHGNVTNRGTVSPGDPVGTFTVNNYTQVQYAHLMIQIAGANAGQFGVLDVLGTANLSGHLDPALLDGFVPTIGDSFTFLNAGALNGTLFIFNRNIDNEPLHWVVNYFPTYAFLTVAPGNAPIPDLGSTFLLLTLGLLGLVTFRRQLLRGQP
jgi:autotransporter-associated beta strand protein